MDCIENIMNVVHIMKKGGHKDTFEKYYIYNGTKIIIKLMTKVDS